MFHLISFFIEQAHMLKASRGTLLRPVRPPHWRSTLRPGLASTVLCFLKIHMCGVVLLEMICYLTRNDRILLAIDIPFRCREHYRWSIYCIYHGFNGDSRIQQMEVRQYHIVGHILWGYSLKFRPETQALYMVGTSNLGS